MKFNKPPFHDPLIDLKIPLTVQHAPDGGIQNIKMGETESPMAHAWANYHALLNDQLSQNLSDAGYIFPSTSQADLNTNIPKFGQSIVYNDSLNRMELNNGNRTTPANRTPTSEPLQTYGAMTTSHIATEAVKPENLGRIYVNSDTNELQFSIDGATVRTITSI